MLDLIGIMFSSIMMLVVILRAVQLDRSEPWFKPVTRKDGTVKPTARPWRRGG